MPIGKGVLFQPKVLPAGKLVEAMQAAATSTGGPRLERFSLERRLADGSRQSDTLEPAQIDPICDLAEEGLMVSAYWTPPDSDLAHHLHIFGGQPGYAEARANAPSAGAAEALLQAFMSVSGLDPFEQPTPKAQAASTEEPAKIGSRNVGSAAPLDTALIRRVEALEASAARPPAPGFRAFLSYRFTTPAGELLAAHVLRFLTALGVEVVSGVGYEPRRVSDKVAERLLDIDLLVLVVTADGESAWTRDEIATASARGISVVPLVEEGSRFEPGMFGDLEYITFASGHIGDAFLPLVEAVNWVRRKRQSS